MISLAFLPNLGPTELIILAVFALGLILPIWGIIDAARRSDEQWEGIDNNKDLWVLIMLLGTVFCGPVGIIVSTYYLAVLRPRLDAVGDARF